jgi:DNA-binding NarL/FixJ family response regulator
MGSMGSIQGRIRIVIVDDHPLFREGLRQVIRADRRFLLVGEADQGQAALELILKSKPDLAVLDIHLPLMNGFEVAAALQARRSPTRVVILTMLREEAAFHQAMNVGIQGYVLKENAVGEIVNCMLAVAGDSAYVSPTLSGYLLPRYNRAMALTRAQPGLADLTAAQRLVLRLIADRKTTKQIAAELSVSPRTVESHRAKITDKLSLKGSNSLLHFALENRNALLDLGGGQGTAKSVHGRTRS